MTDATSSTPHPLLAKVERFLKRSNMSAAKLGKLALKDPRFVYQLRKGRDPGWKTQQKIEQFIREQRGAA